jgi:hypothetical protein
MQPLTPEGQQKIEAIANKYRVSIDAVNTLLQALVYGNGTMAQFNHPELGGGGQWMRGGMTMVGDMFNNNLKALVDNLCVELSQVLATQPFEIKASGSSQFQHQGNQAQSNGFAFSYQWPTELGTPTFSGGQNNDRYAYFANKNRLAITRNGQMTVYDTLDHHITGTSQQQQNGIPSIAFTSQYGVVNLQNLPVVSGDVQLKNSPPDNQQSTMDTAPDIFAKEDIFAKIERLADLKQKGILSEDEFAKKKAELLDRL